VVLDTSALLAILLSESDAPRFEHAIAGATPRLLSAANALEAAIVVEARFGAAGGRELDLLLHAADVDVVPVTREHFEIARDAFRRYGRGRHRAGLNYGDLFAYALSKSSGEPLLFKGEDFARTDVLAVL
jgi:ribonuclease VapC